jgi:hypothetical protein
MKFLCFLIPFSFSVSYAFLASHRHGFPHLSPLRNSELDMLANLRIERIQRVLDGKKIGQISSDCMWFENFKTTTMDGTDKILDFGDYCPLLKRFPKQIYIPDDYSTLYNYIMHEVEEEEVEEEGVGKVVVIGTPGIGKTVFGLYMIWKLLSQNELVLYEFAMNQIMLLLPDRQVILSRTEAKYLCDKVVRCIRAYR